METLTAAPLNENASKLPNDINLLCFSHSVQNAFFTSLVLRVYLCDVITGLQRLFR